MLAGCTIHHPSIPPSPLVAKTTDFGRAGAVAGGATEVDAETVVVDMGRCSLLWSGGGGGPVG